MPKIKRSLVSLQEPKKRLREIDKYLLDASEGLILFVRYLDRFLTHPKITPQGFLKAWNRAYNNLRRGREGHRKIKHPLVGKSGLEFFLIVSSFKKVAGTIFPPEFAAQLYELWVAEK